MIVGTELTSYFTFDPQTGFDWVWNAPGALPGWTFCFLPQAWSVGLELVFYAMVPLLVHLSTRGLWTLVIVNIIGIVVPSILWSYADWNMLIDHFFPVPTRILLPGHPDLSSFLSSPESRSGRPRLELVRGGCAGGDDFSFWAGESVPQLYTTQAIYLFWFS